VIYTVKEKLRRLLKKTQWRMNFLLVKNHLIIEITVLVRQQADSWNWNRLLQKEKPQILGVFNTCAHVLINKIFWLMTRYARIRFCANWTCLRPFLEDSRFRYLSPCFNQSTGSLPIIPCSPITLSTLFCLHNVRNCDRNASLGGAPWVWIHSFKSKTADPNWLCLL